MALGARELLLIIRARDEATRTVSALGRSMRGLDKDAKAAIQAQAARGQALTSAGVGIAGVGVAMAGALTDMTTAAVEYQRQSALTFTQLDKTKGSVKEIEDIGKRVARAIPVPFEQVQTSLYDIFSSMDVNTKQAETLLTEFSKAAVGGQVDLQEAARGTIGIMNAYNMKITDVNKVNDVMFQLVRKGVGTYGEFARTIGRAVPSAVRAGQSIEDLAGMMAFLTRNGLSAAMSSASAARALDAISHPKTVGNLAKLGSVIEDVTGMKKQQAMKLFGKSLDDVAVQARGADGKFRPMTAIMKDLGQVLMKLPPADRVATLQEIFKGSGGTIQARRFFDIAIKQYPQLISLTDSMKHSQGALTGAYDTMKTTGASALTSLQNNWEILKVEIGQSLVPVLKTVTDWLKQVFDWWNQLSDGEKKAIGVVAAVVAGLTILIGVVTTVAGVMAILAAGAAAVGIGLAPLILIAVGVVAGIAGLVAAFKAFWAAGGPVVDICKSLFQWMGNTLKDAWNDLVDAVQPILPLLKWVGIILGGVLLAAIVIIVAAIKVLAWTIKWLIIILTALVKFIVAGLVGAWNFLVKIVKIVVNAIVGFFNWLYDVLIGHSIIPDIVNGVVGWFKKMGQFLAFVWNTTKKIAMTIWNAIWKFFEDIIKGIYNTAVTWINNIKGKWNAFWAANKVLWNAGIKWISNVWNNFLTGLHNIWVRLTKPIRDKIDGFINGIKTAFNNAKTNITRIWQSIQGPLKVPVNFMIGLYNNGIANMANKLASFVGIKTRLPTLNKFAVGGVLPGYTPGRDPYSLPLAAFSGGEAVMRPEFTRAVGSGFVDQANMIARHSGVDGVRKWLRGPDKMGNEGAAFKNGGIVQRFAGGGILDSISNFIKGVKDFTIGNVEKSAKALLDKVFGGAVPGGGMIKEIMTRFPIWMKTIFMKWIKDKVSLGGMMGGPGMRGALAWALGQRGKPYVWGGVGPGGYDCSGFMSAITNVIHGKNPYSRLFSTRSFGSTGGPGGFVRNLRSGFMVGVTNAGVGHMAGTLLGSNVESSGSVGVRVAGGARGFNNALFPYRYGLKFDGGGYLAPGMTLAMNATGRRERVLDADQTEAYDKGYGRTQQIFNIYTHEINPRLHAAQLGWELETRSAP